MTSRHSVSKGGRALPLLGAVGTVLTLALSAALAGGLVSLPAGGSAAPAIGAAGSSLALSGASPAVAHPSVANLTNVTFQALGLPNGSLWSVAAGNPPVTQNNTTVGTKGKMVFAEPNGTLNYSISGPAGFGVAKIEGKGIPSQTSDLINGSTVLTVFFGPIVTLMFNETGLANGTVWGISLHTALPHGGPAAPANQTTNGTSLSFQVVKGTYKFVVIPMPFGYRATPAKGAIGTGHVGPKMIKFHELHGAVVFHESGLAPNTVWQVNVTGPVVLSRNSSTSSIRFVLPAGNYSFTVWNFSSEHPTPESGTFSISGTGAAVTEAIVYAA